MGNRQGCCSGVCSEDDSGFCQGGWLGADSPGDPRMPIDDKAEFDEFPGELCGSVKTGGSLLPGRDRMPVLTLWEHIPDAVKLWGHRGGSVIQPQPLFDAISALMTVDATAQKMCGIHQASVHMGSNAKVARALVPLVEGEVADKLFPPGTVSLSARTPIDELGLKQRLEAFLIGDILIEDPELVNAIHVQDVDWADVDNGIAVLCLANCLKQSKAKHKLHAFVSERRCTAEFATTVVHKDDEGKPIKTEVMTDEKGMPVMGLQFRVTTDEDLGKFEVKSSIMPYIKELDWESKVHNEEDMSRLAHFECAVLKTQLIRAGIGDAVVGRSGVFEKAGLSGNVHKLTWFLYDHDGSVRSPEAYSKDAEAYFDIGVGNSAARRKVFEEHTRTDKGLLKECPPPANFETFFTYCREHPDDKIVVHCGGPIFLVRALAQQQDLRKRVILIGAMFLSYDGAANLLGMNFNEGVAAGVTEEVFSEDGKLIHLNFPNARLLCVTTETCKSPLLTFVPFQAENEMEPSVSDAMSRQASCQFEKYIPDKAKNQPLIIISDDGRDPDDELAKVLLKSLTQRGLAKCYGFIANLNPSKERARLARGTLDNLGMETTPVGVGHDMIEGSSANYEFNVPYMGNLSDCRESGVDLFVEVLKGFEADTKTTLVCLSGLADAWLLLKDHHDLFCAKIERVVIMGGVQTEGDNVKLDTEGFMIPDNAANNGFDKSAAESFYRDLQFNSIPLTIVTRWMAYAAKLPFTLYDAMAATGHPVGVRLQKMQQGSIDHLWVRACMEQDDPKREGLPGRCDKAWFCKVFLGGNGLDRDGSGSIWDLASTFQAYDPVALLAALHGVRAKYVRPHFVTVTGKHGPVVHEILGLTEANNGVTEGTDLSDFLQSAILKGLKTPGEAL